MLNIIVGLGAILAWLLLGWLLHKLLNVTIFSEGSYNEDLTQDSEVEQMWRGAVIILLGGLTLFTLGAILYLLGLAITEAFK